MPANYYSLLDEIRGLLKGNLEKNQIRSIALFAAALESVLAGIESTVDLVEVTADYTGSSRNSCILADTSSGDINVYLPKAENFINYAAGTTKLIYVKKADAGGNNVIIHADAVDTIEGSPTYTLTSPLQSVTFASDGNDWFILGTNATGGGGGGSGDVVGPASATDNAVVRFNLTSGKLVQNSTVTITDLGSIVLPAGQTVDGRDVSVDGAKLDTIETNADVTDATNVNAAGAVMESDYTPAHSLLVQQSGTGSPSSLSVGNNTILGRASGGGSLIAALSAASVKTILNYQGSEVDFTPNGDIAATDVQSAIVEVRNDTDTKLGSKVDLAGQLGGTAASPDVRGVRETSGPTLLTLGSIADGDYLRRIGSTIVGDTPAGGGGDPTMELIEGFTSTDYFSHPTAAPGNAVGFSVVWYGQIRGYVTGAGQFLISKSDTSDGWGIQIGGPAAGGFYVIAFMGPTAISQTFHARPSVVHLALVFDGTTLEFYIDGIRAEFTGTPTFAASPEPLLVGRVNPWVEPFTQGGWAGAGYVEAALTPEQLQDHVQACRDAGREMVAGAISWDHLWSVSAPGVGFPSTIEDLAGADDLTRSGTGITATVTRQII